MQKHNLEKLQTINSKVVIDIPIFIIHLTGNTQRLQNIYTQLQSISSTNTYILHNHGYKKFVMNEICNSRFDLIHAFIKIFEFCSVNHTNQNILIFEDDFELNIEPANFYKIYKNEIEPFLFKADLYLLGVFPFLLFGDTHNRALLTGGMHAVIYSPKYIKKILNLKLILKADVYKHINDWDVFSLFEKSRYCYKFPLFCKKITETENYKNWVGFYGLTDIFKKLVKCYELDKNFKNYKQMYALAHLSFFILMIIFFSIIFLKI